MDYFLAFRCSFCSFQGDAQNQTADLEVGKHFLVTVRVYHPFYHKIGLRALQRLRCNQEIVLLGNQLLTDLRDKILCPSDFAALREQSENPEQNPTQRAMVNMNFYTVFNSKCLLQMGHEMMKRSFRYQVW